jgi:hypothetical protein
MRSYTSGSKTLSPTQAIVLLLVLTCCYLLALELAARLLLPHLSHTAGRIATDYLAAKKLPRKWADGSDSVLIVGNSLLADGIDRTDLKQRMPGYHVALYPFEATTYLDWYFGLRRLFAEGSRPSLVVLSVSLRHVLSDSTNEESFARFMMRIDDLMSVSRAAKLDMMSTSEYFFAHFSEWLATRAGIRNELLTKWLPGAQLLVERFWTRGSAVPVTAVHLAVERLREMRDLCNAYGARFALLVPPSPSVADPVRESVSEAAQVGVTVLLPYYPGEMPREAFRDGFHLNSQGAARFTERTAAELRRAFPPSPTPP